MSYRLAHLFLLIYLPASGVCNASSMECSSVYSYLPTPVLRQDMTLGQFLSEV